MGAATHRNLGEPDAMHTPRDLKLTLSQALDMIGGLDFAARQYDAMAARYAYGEPLYNYYDQRAKSSRRGAEHLRKWTAIIKPGKWHEDWTPPHRREAKEPA